MIKKLTTSWIALMTALSVCSPLLAEELKTPCEMTYEEQGSALLVGTIYSASKKIPRRVSVSEALKKVAQILTVGNWRGVQIDQSLNMVSAEAAMGTAEKTKTPLKFTLIENGEETEVLISVKMPPLVFTTTESAVKEFCGLIASVEATKAPLTLGGNKNINVSQTNTGLPNNRNAIEGVNNAVAQSPAPIRESQIEAAYWERATKYNYLLHYKNYLIRYPKGVFVNEAIKRIRQLELAKMPVPAETSKNLFRAVESRNIEIFDALLMQHPDLNCQNCDSEYNTPLMIAVRRPVDGKNNEINPFLIKLIENGADVNRINRSGSTALAIAVAMRGDSTEIHSTSSIGGDIKYLLLHGADSMIDNVNGDTPLHIWAKSQQLIVGLMDAQKARGIFDEVMYLLVSNGANINVQNNAGVTPLMIAARSCMPLAVDSLLSLGANPSIKNKDGNSAFDIALNEAASRGLKSCNDTWARLK